MIILPTPENAKRNTTGQQRPISNCSLQLQLTVDSGTPRYPARSSTVHCQSELFGTVENTVFAGRWCGVCPNLCQVISQSFPVNREYKLLQTNAIYTKGKKLTIFVDHFLRESRLPSLARVGLCLVRVGVPRVSWAVRYLDKP